MEYAIRNGRRKGFEVASIALSGAALLLMCKPLVSNAAAEDGAGQWRILNLRLDTGVHPVFAFNFSSGTGEELRIERQFGSSNSWTSVYSEVVTSAQGRGTLPIVPQGTYAYRALLMRGQAVIWESRPVRLYSYSSVSLGVVCQNITPYPWQCTDGAVQVGDTAFEYTADVGVSAGDGIMQYPAFSTIWTNDHNSCKSGDLMFSAKGTGYVTYLEVIRADADPQIARGSDGTVGTLRFRLDTGPWILDASTTSSKLPSLWLSGTMDCYTSTGVLPQ